jgi:hypothetical protein
MTRDRAGGARVLDEFAADSLERQDALIDRAYYEGAKQAAAIAHQSLAALDAWINTGCGNRLQQARAALEETP